MKNHLVFAILVFAAGCGDSSNKPTDLAVPNDLAVSMDAALDMTGVACTMVGAWPGLNPTGFYDDTQGYTAAFGQQTLGTPYDDLSIEAWHGRTYPSTVTFHPGELYNDCDTCVIYYQDCDDTGCGATYFAQGGTATITRADDTELMGSMKASATNLRLVEWDLNNDVKVANARCIEIASASWDVSWAVGDGGSTD